MGQGDRYHCFLTMEATSLWLFLVSITLLTISPGVDTVLVIRNASRGGMPDGLVTTLGICSGLFVHAVVSAVGISVILLQSAFLFSLLKLAGAGYLVWLGWVSLRAAFRETEGLGLETEVARDFRLLRSAREGLLSKLLNPKPIVFYMAFLPQFVDQAGNVLAQSLMLAFIHFVISVVWLGLVAAAVDRMRRWLAQANVRRAIDVVVGSALGIFGLILAREALMADQ